MLISLLATFLVSQKVYQSFENWGSGVHLVLLAAILTGLWMSLTLPFSFTCSFRVTSDISRAFTKTKPSIPPNIGICLYCICNSR